MDEKQKILIVDDRKENLVALRQVLSDVDAEIVEATSGNQALKTTLLYDFSLAILDVQMPGMDGYELAELLRGDPKTANLPVIFMTAAYGEEIDVFKGYEAGAVDYIVKPYNPAVLLAKVYIFLDLQRAQKELARRVLELSASEERYRTLVTTIPDIVYRIDNEGRFTFLNDAVRSIGYSPEELIGLPFAEIVIPADVENVSRRFVLPRFAGKRTGDEGAPKLFDERRTRSRQTLTMEVRLVSRRTGRAVPGELHSGGWPVLTAEVNSSGLYGSIEGRPPTFLGTVGIIRDISQRKEAEDELSRYRQGLEKMVEDQTAELKERVKEVSCLYAISSLFAKPSRSIDETLKSAADLIPTGWLHPEVARARIIFEGTEFASEGFRETPWRQSADIVLSGETVGTVEVCYLEERPVLDEGPFLKEEWGLIDELARQLAVMIQRDFAHARLEHVNSVLRSIRDINQLIVHEKRRGPLIQMACENLMHTRGLKGAWIVLTDGLPDRVEGAQAGFNDIALSELLNLFQRGETPTCFRPGQTESGKFVTDDPAAACRDCPLADCHGGSGAITIELKHGNRRYGCMGIAVPMKFANDKEEASLFDEIAGDIAFALHSIELEKEHKQSEEEKGQLQAQLQQAQKMEAIGTLAGGIAHDFNNILSSVLGYTELALDDAEEGTRLRSNLQTVLSAGERARDLVQQILAFSRQSETAFSPIQVKLITKEALRLLRAILPTTIEIRQDIQSDSMVLGDPTQIHQILLNLGTNADHAMREKGGLLEVTLADVGLDSLFTAKHPDIKPGTHLKLMVRDTGHGIPPHILDRIFDPFFTTKDKSEGTGMGLSVVHGIVKAHGGAITVQSEPGKGTVFNAFLPVIEKTIAMEAPIEKPLSTGTERILFVDDEIPLVRLGKWILEPLGYDVTTRTSSIEALELFKAQPDRFDLVITDMTMPNLTGSELALKLGKIRPDIPIILCTGFSHEITAEKSKEMGIKAFLFKPILSEVMAETVRRVLDEKD